MIEDEKMISHNDWIIDDTDPEIEKFSLKPYFKSIIRHSPFEV